MRKYGIVILFVIIGTTLLITPVKAQVTPQVRYMEVEQINVEPYLKEFSDPVWINVSHFVYTFALFDVENWGERCYFTTWLDTELVANWSIGFSAGDPPSLQGIYKEEASGLIDIITVLAEFPYASAQILHPEDGLQTYYFYRMHFYFNTTVFKGGEVRLAGDYEKVPTYEGSELVVIKMKNSKRDGDVENFRFKTMKQKK